MASRAATEYRYEKLTWPEINDAVDMGKVCILPCGAVEQHGHHLPLDVDLVCPGGIAHGAGQAHVVECEVEAPGSRSEPVDEPPSDRLRGLRAVLERMYLDHAGAGTRAR